MTSLPRHHWRNLFNFFGHLRLLPNADAVKYFCEHILPQDERWHRLAVRSDHRGHGSLRESTPTCRRGRGAMLGYRARRITAVQRGPRGHRAHPRGGGTRIKIWKRCQRRRAVVATSVALEGIDARHEQQALGADTPGRSSPLPVLRLMNSPASAGGSAACRLWQHAYSMEAMKRSVSLHAVPAD